MHIQTGTNPTNTIKKPCLSSLNNSVYMSNQISGSRPITKCVFVSKLHKLKKKPNERDILKLCNFTVINFDC